MIVKIILGYIVIEIGYIIFFCFNFEDKLKLLLEKELVKVGYFMRENNKNEINLVSFINHIMPGPIITFLVYKFILIPRLINKITSSSERYSMVFKKIMLFPAEVVEDSKYAYSYDALQISRIYLETRKEFIDTQYSQKEFLQKYQSKILNEDIKYFIV